MKKHFGFTLTELMTTLAIVVILALLLVPIYRSYVKKGVATEGKALLGEINAAQQIYYSRHGQYYAGTVGQQLAASFGVDSRSNKYFTSYYVLTTGTNSFTAVTATDGQSLTLLGSQTALPTIVEN